MTACPELSVALTSVAPLASRTATVQPWRTFIASASVDAGVEPAPCPRPITDRRTAEAGLSTGSVTDSHGEEEQGQRTQPPQAPCPTQAVEFKPSMANAAEASVRSAVGGTQPQVPASLKALSAFAIAPRDDSATFVAPLSSASSVI